MKAALWSWRQTHCSWQCSAFIGLAVAFEGAALLSGVTFHGLVVFPAFVLGVLGDRLIRSGWSFLIVPLALNLVFAGITTADYALAEMGGIQQVLTEAVADPVRSIARLAIVVLGMFLLSLAWNFPVAAGASLGALLSAFLRVSSE